MSQASSGFLVFRIYRLFSREVNRSRMENGGYRVISTSGPEKPAPSPEYTPMGLPAITPDSEEGTGPGMLLRFFRTLKPKPKMRR